MAPKQETALEAWGQELRFACEAARMTGKQLAEVLHVAPNTISQWMTGKRKPDIKDVKRCDAKLGTNGYLTRYFERWVTRELPTEWADRWLTAEENANIIQNFELSVIPGLLQTEDYARERLRHNTDLSPAEIEEHVRRRMERQKILGDENPTVCIFVIDEYALRRPVGGRDVMVAQLSRLAELAEQRNIIVKVVRSGTDYHAGCPFMIARLGGAEIVNLDDALIGHVVEGNGHVARINTIWEGIREAALSPADSLELIKEVLSEWEA